MTQGTRWSYAKSTEDLQSRPLVQEEAREMCAEERRARRTGSEQNLLEGDTTHHLDKKRDQFTRHWAEACTIFL